MHANNLMCVCIPQGVIEWCVGPIADGIAHSTYMTLAILKAMENPPTTAAMGIHNAIGAMLAAPEFQSFGFSSLHVLI